MNVKPLSTPQTLRIEPAALFVDSQRGGVDLDKRVGFADVSAADEHRRFSVVGAAHQVKVLPAVTYRHRHALGVLGARRREPVPPGVQHTRPAANLAGAGGAGFG